MHLDPESRIRNADAIADWGSNIVQVWKLRSWILTLIPKDNTPVNLCDMWVTAFVPVWLNVINHKGKDELLEKAVEIINSKK